MKHYLSTKWIFLGIFFISISLFSCSKHQDQSEDTDPTVYKAAVTKSYSLTEPKQIEWVIIDPDSISPPTISALDIDKLPSKPFRINEFKPLKSPMKEYPLEWDKIERIDLHFDTLDKKHKISILPKPVITKMQKPATLKGTTTGLISLSKTEGLPANLITSIIENEAGTFWLTTESGGVSLYNGESLYTYPYDGVLQAVTDHNGRLWLVTPKGFYALDFKNNTEYHFPTALPAYKVYCDHTGTIWVATFEGVFRLQDDLKHPHFISNVGFNRVTSFMEDRNHNLWIGSVRSVTIIDEARQGFKKIEGNDEWKIGQAAALHEDRKGYVWVGNSFPEYNGSLSFSLEERKVRVLGADSGFVGHARLVQEDDEGRIWLMQNGSFSILSADYTQIKTITFEAELFSANNPLFGCSIRDQRGNVWIGTMESGVILIEREGPISEHLDESDGLMSANIYDIDEDNREEVWLATGEGGINIYDPKKGELSDLDFRKLKNRKGYSIRSIKEFEPGKYFLENQSGFSIIDRREKKLLTYDIRSFHSSRLEGFLMDDSTNIWLPNTNGILVYDTKSNHVKSIMGETAQFPVSRAKEIIDDGAGRYWIATEGAGLMIIDPVENTIQYLTEKEGLCHDNVGRILLRENGELWVATKDGLSIINSQEQTITNVGAEQGMLPDELFEVQENGGTIYLGSVNGLIQMKPKPGKTNEWNFYNYNEAQGFPANDYIRGASHAMKNGQLWMGATNPSYMLNILTQEPSIDTVECPVAITGLKIMAEYPSFSRNADLQPFLETNDTLWYENGEKFYLKETLPQDSNYLTENNIKWDSLSLPYKMPHGLKIPYDQNSLEFSFSNSCAFNRDKISYRYKLTGKEDQWAYSNASTSKTYFNLPAGHYTFEVATKGVNAKWGRPVDFNFQITPPWWKTWWAYLLYVLLSFVAVWGIIQYRSKQLKAQNRLLEKKVNERTAELKASQAQLIQSEKMASLGELTAGIAHEIQNPLNFVNNFSELNAELLAELQEEITKGDLEEAKAITKDLKANEEKINHHGKRAEAIVKGMLQHSRTSSAEKEPTDINKLADEYLRLAYHGLRAKDKTFNATLETDFDESIGMVNVIPQDIGRVVLNLITNAFYAVNEKLKANRSQLTSPSHKYQPTVAVSTKKRSDTIVISVKDNGNGIPKDIIDKIFQPFFTTKPTGEGTGLGLSMSYDIVTKGHQGKFEVKSTEGNGSEFIIKLPISKS